MTANVDTVASLRPARPEEPDLIYALSDSGRYSGKSWTRLLRTPIGGGGLLRQNFALIETGAPAQAKAVPTPISEPEAIASVSVPGALATESNTQQATSALTPSLTNGSTGKSEPAGPGTYEFASTEDLDNTHDGTAFEPSAFATSLRYTQR